MKIKKNTIKIIVLLLLSFIIGSSSMAYQDQLDHRYLAEYQENRYFTTEYLYNGLVALPLEAIYAAQWYGETGSYKPTIIIYRHYFKEELVDVVACVKYLNWWEPEAVNCR